MKWYEHVENPQSLKALYNSIPDLTGVELGRVNWNTSYSSVEFHIRMQRFPDNPSKRWGSGNNVVTMIFKLEFVETFKANFTDVFHKEPKVTFEIIKSDVGITIHLKDEENKELLNCSGEYIFIVGFQPYVIK